MRWGGSDSAHSPDQAAGASRADLPIVIGERPADKPVVSVRSVLGHQQRPVRAAPGWRTWIGRALWTVSLTATVLTAWTVRSTMFPAGGSAQPSSAWQYSRVEDAGAVSTTSAIVTSTSTVFARPTVVPVAASAGGLGPTGPGGGLNSSGSSSTFGTASNPVVATAMTIDDNGGERSNRGSGSGSGRVDDSSDDHDAGDDGSTTTVSDPTVAATATTADDRDDDRDDPGSDNSGSGSDNSGSGSDNSGSGSGSSGSGSGSGKDGSGSGSDGDDD